MVFKVIQGSSGVNQTKVKEGRRQRWRSKKSEGVGDHRGWGMESGGALGEES